MISNGVKSTAAVVVASVYISLLVLRPESCCIVFAHRQQEQQQQHDLPTKNPNTPTNEIEVVDVMCEPGSEGCGNVPVDSIVGTDNDNLLREILLKRAASHANGVTNVEEVYDAIDDEEEEKEFDRELYSCRDYQQIFEDGGDWKLVEKVNHFQQETNIFYNVQNHDFCLVLGDDETGHWLHGCASNRPHYHEVFVHYPARFLDQVKRVLFIGGGDSMVLHEVLKYKDLEKVVGLELDQQVVRTVFHRFGTQPYFDNDKVEWYFGDAAAALRALPRDYYGTFDLVVVDIMTYIAEVLKVTEEYSIMDASMLLLQPNGIIIKNEDEGYIPGTSMNLARYMVDLVYHDVPVYCLQMFVMGSNAINFTEKQPVDHGVPTLFLKDVNEFQSQFDTWYTASDGAAQEALTDGDKVDQEEIQNDATFHPLGLIMIIEAEETRVSLNSSPTITSLISQVLEDHLLSKSEAAPSIVSISSADKKLKGGYIVSFLLKEGSVVARCFPLISYCAFDLQLWSDLHKIDGLKEGLLESVKSRRSSVYRIITSGVDSSSKNDKTGPPPGLLTESAVDERNLQPEEKSLTYYEYQKMSNSTLVWRNATLHFYDNTDAIKQWSSQEAIGVQSVLQFEIDPILALMDIDKNNMTQVLNKKFQKLFKVAHGKKLVPAGLKVIAQKLEKNQSNTTDRYVFTMPWDSGNMVAMWDGMSRIVINLMELKSTIGHLYDQIFAMETLFEEAFHDWLMTGLDVFPRGINGVINFEHDYNVRNYSEPFWAPIRSSERRTISSFLLNWFYNFFSD
jgi:spermidine synthase